MVWPVGLEEHLPLFVSQVESSVQGVAPLQQGSPSVPHVTLHFAASVSHSLPLLHLSLAQHGWPGAPQVLQTLLTQARPELHGSELPVQHALPDAPQSLVALAHTLLVLQVMPLQQSLELLHAPPDEPQHLPSVQLRPEQQSVGLAQVLVTATQQPPLFGLHWRPAPFGQV